MSNNVKLMDIGDKDKIRADIEKMKRDLPIFLELTSLTAQIRKASYDALIKEGFTEIQALELCKAGLTL